MTAIHLNGESNWIRLDTVDVPIKSAEHGGMVWLSDGHRSNYKDFSASIWPYPLDSSKIESCFSAFNVYPDPDYRGLVSAAATYYSVAQEQIFPANGSTEALYLTMLTLKPKRVAIFEPTFSEYSKAAQWATSSEVKISHLSADVCSHFRPILQVPEADLAILCNPNNPTGTFVHREELIAWIDACSSAGVFVMIDEAFIEFIEEPDASISCELACKHNFIVLRSMTKFFGIPGIRLGFALGPREVIEKIWTNRIPWSINTIAQQMGRYLARDAPSPGVIAKKVARERAFLSEKLKEFGWTVLPSTANFILCRLPHGHSSRDLLSKLSLEGFLLRDASNFHGLDKSYIRCAVKEHSENEALVKAIGKCI